jgi:two-component system, OmpR family, sensor kinase
MKRLPLRIRLTLAFGVAMAVVIAVLGAFLYVRVRGALDEQLNQSLRTRAEAAAFVDPGHRVGDDESFVQVLGGDTTGPLTRAQVDRARHESFFVERDRVPGLDDGPVRLFVMATGGEVVVAGASLEDRDEAVAALLTQLAIGGPVALLLASLAGYALAGATLRPVEGMRRRAQAISARVDGERLPEPEGDDEIARLARTLNAMLARLEAGLERERRFAAEASHELRTPLASLKAELELALRRPRSPDELRKAIASAAEETDRLAALAEDLLVLARSDEGELRLDRRPVPAGELLETVAQRFAARAEDADVSLETHAADALEVPGDRARLEQALGNLVDNALRHGAGTVRLEAAAENGAVALSVSDEGDGFAPEFLPRAFERFSRADGARAGGSTGLGLAIVEAIARAHGGTAYARNIPAGGASVALVLPVATSTRSR